MTTGIWTLLAIAISFLITSVLGKWVIPYLHKLKYGQTILDVGPSWHKNKQGTPTMGGIMFIIGIILTIIILVPMYYAMSRPSGINMTETPLMTCKLFSGLGMALCFGVIGFVDDYIKVAKKRNLGLTAKQKLVFQFLSAAIYLGAVFIAKKVNGSSDMTNFFIPFIGNIDLGVFYWPISAVLIVGVVNAVNLTDGIDGLNSSVTFFAALSFMMITTYLGMMGLSIMSAALIGGCLGFLVWNFHPAKVFMGDTGSLFLGGIVCALAFGTDMPFLLVLIGLVYICEMFSVILQVAYFKITHGKRLFKMSPIHHHFEMCGWSETKICMTFSIVEIIMGAISFVLVVNLV